MEESKNPLSNSLENFQLACRICLNLNASEDIFYGDPPILTKLLACTSLSITDTDGLPRFICFTCLLRLNDAYDLRCQSENNDRILQEMLQERAMFKTELKDDLHGNELNMDENNVLSDIWGHNVKDEFEDNSSFRDDNIDNKIKVKKKRSRFKWEETLKSKVRNDRVSCSYCNREFRKKDVLAKHILTHTNPQSYECDVCNKRFRSKLLFRKHELSHKEQLYICDECGKTFKNYHYINKHKNNVHSRMKFLCLICNKSLKTKSSLKAHILIHQNVKKYICTRCGLKFLHMQSLKGHLRIHDGHKPYSCKFCESKFSTLKSKIEHERLHTGHRPYQCPICSKPFAQKSNMKSHFVHNHKTEKWELHNPKSLRKES